MRLKSKEILIGCLSSRRGEFRKDLTFGIKIQRNSRGKRTGFFWWLAAACLLVWNSLFVLNRKALKMKV